MADKFPSFKIPELIKGGLRLRADCGTLYYASNSRAGFRVIAPIGIWPSAVDRHRVVRRLKAAISEVGGVDGEVLALFVAGRGADSLPFDHLKASCAELIKKIKV